jgi:hypothetical protein
MGAPGVWLSPKEEGTIELPESIKTQELKLFAAKTISR